MMPNRVLSLMVVAVIAALAMPVGAEEAAAERTYLDDLPPLIDRDVFFGDPELAGAQISPDGAWISFRKKYRDVMNIWVKGIDEPFDEARPITADTKRPVRGSFWSEDSRYVLYVQDKGGNENYHVYAVDPKAEPEEATGVPPARDLTPLEGVRALIYAVPEATPNEILVGLNDRDPSLHDVYRLDLDTGERELLIQNDSNVAAWVPDLEGEIHLAYRQTADAGSEMLRVVDGKLGEAIYSCTFEETCAPLRFHTNGEQVYIQSNKGTGIDLTRLMLMDAETGETELVESDPEGEVDFGGPIFSDATEGIIGTFYVGDRVRIYPHTDELKRRLEYLRSELPDGEISLLASTEDETIMLVSVSRDVNPGSVYVYDTTKPSVTKLYDSRPELPTEHLAPMTAIRYPARDGARIPGYLTIPKGVGEGTPVPTIILPHGGPWARDYWGYDSFAQFLANRGYAVLQPNFRGSTGYGKAFLNAGNNEWGTGRMQHDLSDAVKYLVGNGIAAEDEVAIMGGSYGGYATLAGLTFTPDLYAAGVDIVGPSNIITLLESIPPYWGPIKKLFDVRVGDPGVAEDKERLEAQSPLFFADNIEAPLLVIQGANDPRVKKAEADQIVVAMRELELPVKYIVAPDEGHGFAGEENRLAMFAAIEEFLAEHLGGRSQKSMAPEVEKRLREITVDIATVTMPVPNKGADAASTAELSMPDADRVNPSVSSYTTTMSLGGQEIEVTSTVTVSRETKDGNELWQVVSDDRSPMGSSKDVVLLDPTTLLPIKRIAEQGPATVTMSYAADSISGGIDMQGQQMPIEVDLEAPVAGDGAALDLYLAGLDLEPGDEAFLRTFDLMSQKVRLWSLEVAGAETVEVPAGAYEAMKLVIEPLDDAGGGQTTWVATEAPHLVVRAVKTLPAQLGGGTATSVLTAVD